MEKLIEIFNDLNRLAEQQYFIILAIITLLFIIMIITAIIKCKKVPLFETALFIFPVAIIGFDCYQRYIKGHSYHATWNESFTLKIVSVYAYVLAFLVAFIIFVIRLVKNKGKRICSDNSSLDICGTYLRNEKKLYLNKNFFLQLSALSISKKKWNKKCLGIYIDNEDIEYENLGEYISNLEDTFALRIRFPYEKELILTGTQSAPTI